MKRYAVSILLPILFGAAALPLFAQSSLGYLEQGMVSAQLSGHSYYVAMGEVNLYRVGFLGSQASTGQTVESAAAIRVDKNTGKIERIVTLQPNVRGTQTSGHSAQDNSATAAGSARYVIGDLIGGITVADIEPYGTWLDALRAMRQAITELRVVGQFPGPAQQDASQVPPVVVGQPQVVVQQPVIVPPPIYVQPPEYYSPPPIYQPPTFFQQPPVMVPPPDYGRRPPMRERPPLRVPPPFDGGGSSATRQPLPDPGGSSVVRQPWIHDRADSPDNFGRR